MNILILHFSDMHIRSKDAINMEHITAVMDGLRVFRDFDGAIIAFSGDISAQGLENEYCLASKFIGAVASSLKRRFNLSESNIKVLLAPGNHDMNRNISAQIERNKVEEWYGSHNIEEHIADEFDRMRDFYIFADQQKCFFANEPHIFTRKVLPFSCDTEKYYVEANIFNSAIFSSQDDNGIHYMPEEVYDQLGKWSPAQLSLSIMHHAPEWFWPEQKVVLQEKIYSRSNLVFFGHEHYEVSHRDIRNNGNLCFIQAGGAWWDKNFDNSSYYAGVFDTTTRKYMQYQFLWNAERKFYENKECIEEILPYKHIGNVQLHPKSEYLKSLISEEKQAVCSDFTKYFVFPKLYRDELGDYDVDNVIDSEDDLLSLINEVPQLMIIGGNNAGKSTLLKELFLRLTENHVVLLCGTAEVSGKKQSNIIRETFQDIYGNGEDLYSLFQQEELSKKIILIDDSDRIKPEHLKKLLEGLSAHFGHIIVTSRKDPTFDVREQISSMLNLEQGICQISISKFYADKRRELIEKVIRQCADCSRFNCSELVFTIDNALSIQNLSIKLDPDFIVKFTNYYCAHLEELRVENVNVFSKVFEASIEVAILPFLRRETLGQIKTALSEVAYYIHFNKRYYISENEIDDVVQAYSKKYEEVISTARFIEIVFSANILTRNRNDLRYHFRSNDYLAYFVAMAVSRHFNEEDENAEGDLLQIIEQSCFSINPTILKYIAYSTENIRIIQLLLNQAVDYVSDWEPYNIDVEQFKYLKAVAADGQKEITGNEKKQAIAVATEQEKAMDQRETDAIETLDIYDYNEADMAKLNNQLIRASLQLNVIASILPIFSHIMPAPIKRNLIDALYDIPNRIFSRWASEIDCDIDALIEEFMSDQEGLTQTEANKEIRKIRSALQKLSINLLLNLYYTVARNATTLATIGNLSRSDYIMNTNRVLERIMFYEQVDDWMSFKKEVESLFSQTNSTMVQNMLLSMVYHLMVWSPTLPTDQMHHLIDRFKFKKNFAGILSSRGN